MIDTDYLDNGGRYRDLPENNVIFICTFDPFGMNHPIYLFSMKEEGYPEHSLNEGTMTYFFNTSYKGKEIPQELINLYRYIQTGEACDEFTDMLERRVKKLRLNEEMRSDYMRELTLAMDLRDEGREEGREEGRNEERANTERERANAEKEKQRADNAEKRADNAEKRAEVAENQISELKAELEALKSQILLLSKQQ